MEHKPLVIPNPSERERRALHLVGTYFTRAGITFATRLLQGGLRWQGPLNWGRCRISCDGPGTMSGNGGRGGVDSTREPFTAHARLAFDRGLIVYCTRARDSV